MGPMEFRDPLKCEVRNKQNDSTCLSFGVIAENMSKMAVILNFKMAATRGREYVGGGSTPVQSFMLASKTERFWWISGICRLTSRIVATILLKKD